MTHYFKLLGQKVQLMDEIVSALQDSDASIKLEFSSAVVLQRLFRGVLTRMGIVRQGYYCNEIQRVFRGFLGREKFNKELESKLNSRHNSLINMYCIQIQRCVRGFYSRKYKHSHERRKRYRQRIAEEGEKVRANMDEYANKQAIYLTEQERLQKEHAFKDLATHLHHLVSTRHVQGIYNPNPNHLQTPTMSGLPVENHVRAVVKDLLRTRGFNTRPLVTDINGTKKIPYNGQKFRISIQAQTPYDMPQQYQRREALEHRIVTRDKKSFFAGGKTNIINKDTEPLSNGYPYMDPWANPYLVKGVPESTQQLHDSSRLQKALFVKKNPEQPFVSRVGGNKSSTLPNDTFDTIAEANETGGAAQRYKGTSTQRFGLSTSMDARVHGGVEDRILPNPPVRTSSIIKSTNHSLRVYTHGALTEGLLPSIHSGLNMTSLDSSFSVIPEGDMILEGDYAAERSPVGSSAKNGNESPSMTAISKTTEREAGFRTLMKSQDILSSDDED